MDTFSVSLTKLEAMYLSDALSMHALGPPDAQQGVAFPDLILKILTAFLQIEPGGGEIPVSLTLSELWVVREVSKSSVSVGSEKVGLNLLTKVGKGLLALSSRSDVHAAVTQFGETIIEEPPLDKTKLRRWEQKQSVKEDDDA